MDKEIDSLKKKIVKSAAKRKALLAELDIASKIFSRHVRDEDFKNIEEAKKRILVI
jgi:hypothetical protein